MKSRNSLERDWKDVMSTELMKTEIGCKRNFIGEVMCDPNLVMNERHKMVRDCTKNHQSQRYPEPVEIKFVEAKRLIRQENSDNMRHEKYKRSLVRAIDQLEQSFLLRRKLMEQALTERKLKQPNINQRKVKDIHIDKRLEKMYYADCFPANPCDSLYCQSSSYNIDKSIIVPRLDMRKADESVHRLSPASSVDEPVKETFKESPTEGKEIGANKTSEDAIVQSSESDDQTPDGDWTAKLDKLVKTMLRMKMLYYLTTWRKFVHRARSDKEKLVRQNKIDAFLKRLSEASAMKVEKEASATMAKVKHLKLPPRSVPDNRVTDVEFEKIESELSESCADTCKVLEKNFRDFHPKMRPRVKALSTLPHLRQKYQLELDKRKVFPVPEFLSRMESRYMERKKRWEEIEEKRNRMKAEKEEIEREREEEARRAEEMKRRKDLEELKERRRQRKLVEEERKRQRLRIRQLIKLAREHYAWYLTKRIGFDAWTRLVETRANQTREAIRHFEFALTKMCFIQWRRSAEASVRDKCERADAMANHILQKKYFFVLLRERKETVVKFHVSVDWSEAKLSEKVFRFWLEHVRWNRSNREKQEEMAVAVYERRIAERALRKWKLLPECVRHEREKETRRRVWQRKVQQFLPDYQPSFISEI